MRERIMHCITSGLLVLIVSFIVPFSVHAQSDPELIILQSEYSACEDMDAEVKLVVTGTPPVSITYLYNGDVGNANSSTDTIFLDLADTGIFIITSFRDCCCDYIPTADTILLSRYNVPEVYFTGGGFQCDISQISPLVAHFEGIPPFILTCLINNNPETITTSDYSYTFSYPYDFQVITQQIADLYCSQEYVDTVYFRTGDIPTPEIHGDTVGCVNATALYTVDNDMYYASWSIPGVTVYYFDAESNGSFILVTWSAPGTYQIILKLINTESGCESPETTLGVTVHESPVLDEEIDTTACLSTDGGLQINIPAGTGDAIYWPTIDFHGASVTINDAGTYPFVLTNALGCSDTSALVVVDNCTPKLYVPEAFTPNGDQINDYLELFGIYQNLEFSVYSPSGLLLFRSVDDSDFWDGTNDGREVPEGSYFWSAIYYDGNNAECKETGKVTIIR